MTLDPRIVDTAAASAAASVDGFSHLGSSALSMRSLAVREVMARVLAPGVDFASFRDSVRAGTAGRPKDAAEAERWICMARTIGYQQLAPGDTDDAIAMFKVARSVVPVTRWGRDDIRAFVGVLWLAGRTGEIDAELINQVEPWDRVILATDLIGVSDGIGSSRWIQSLNEILASRGVSPIGLDHEGETAFDRLSATVDPASVNGPLVTVIMSAYKPQAEIFPAVRSILDQTWADFELLVVDDASGPEYGPTLQRLAALDPRVRVLQQRVNRGTYAARNLALGEAAGEYITFHDSDDWAHPERIERQMRPLLNDADCVGTHSSCIRASPDLVFQRLGYTAFRRLNASSHLFRRSVLDQLGGFDRVRKGADTEFHLRLEAAFPGRSRRIWDPLAFVRLNDSSLSRSDFRPGWWSPDRAEYRDSMSVWHQEIETGADPWLGPEVTTRPLTAPRSFLRDTGVELGVPETLVLADWTMDTTLHRAVLAQARNRAEPHLRTGVVQARSIHSRDATRMDRCNRSMRQAIAAGTFDAVSIEDDLHVATLIVAQPDVLQFPTSLPVGLTADRVEIVDDGGEGVHWARSDVERVARDWFGVEPTWRTDPRPFIDPALFLTPRNRFRGHQPVVGWIAEPDGSDLPTDASVMAQTYPDGATFDIRLVGAAQPLSECGIGLDRSWQAYEPEDVTAREFWHQVDFAVAAPHAPQRKALEHTVGEALAAGCVVVLPPEVASWFGDAVVAAEPGDMTSVVLGLHDDRDAYLEQVDRGRLWVRASLPS